MRLRFPLHLRIDGPLPRVTFGLRSLRELARLGAPMRDHDGFHMDQRLLERPPRAIEVLEDHERFPCWLNRWNGTYRERGRPSSCCGPDGWNRSTQ